MHAAFIIFLIAVTKYFMGKKLRKKGFILAHGVCGYSLPCQRSLGHMASTVRKQKEMNAGARLAFSVLLSLRP